MTTHSYPTLLWPPSRAYRILGHAGSALSRAAACVRREYLLELVALAALYYATAKSAHVLAFAGPAAAVVWVPIGVGIAFVYLGGVRLWPGVLIGALAASSYPALPLGAALGATCGNALEVLVAALLMRRLVRHGTTLDTVEGVGRMLVALAAGAAVGATVGSLSLRFGDVIGTDQIPTAWRTWWLGNTACVLVVVPLALAWYAPRPRAWLSGRKLEVISLLTALIGLSELALRSHRPLTYLVFPALIWAGLRFGQRGATLAVALTVGLTIWNTPHYAGPFVFESITRSVLTTQLFIVVAAVSTLCLATVVSEREAFAQRLRTSRSRLAEAADTERRRLERDLHDGAQQRLMAMQVKVALAQESVTREDVVRQLEAIALDAAKAVEELRTLAHGVYPPLLVERGLGDALRSVAMAAPIPVHVTDECTGRGSPAVETAIYFCALEAIQNATKHAGPGASVVVTLGRRSGEIEFTIRDDGAGMATDEATRGVGLVNMQDRIGAVGGALEIVSASGAGTEIRGSVPDTPLVAAAPR